MACAGGVLHPQKVTHHDAIAEIRREYVHSERSRIAASSAGFSRRPITRKLPAGYEFNGELTSGVLPVQPYDADTKKLSFEEDKFELNIDRTVIRSASS